MAIKKAARSKPYLTKRILKKAVTHAFNDASTTSMEVMGYVVKQKDGWIVKESSSGIITKMSKIVGTSTRHGKINLD